MAFDEKPPESDETPSLAGADGEEGDSFIDRDDDLGSGFTDRDYDEDFPGAPSGLTGTSPDPGYAAFASELEDPLADWPSPESELDQLPEVRAAQGAAASAPSTDSDETPESDEDAFEPADEDLLFALKSTVNGIALAIQNTG